MLEEIIIAIQSYSKAHQFIVKNKLWKWILFPGIIYALLFMAGIYFFWESAGFIIDFVFSETGIKAWLKRENVSWINFIFIFGWLILQLVLLMFYFSVFKYVFLIVGSPVFAYLSEKTEAIILNKDYPFLWKRYFTDIARGIKIALKNTVWQTVYSLSILFLALIPFFGWITPLLALFVECYYFGFSMLDYTNERRDLSSSHSAEFINHHKGLAIGNGMIFYIMHTLPLVGWVFAPGYAVIAATLSLQKDINNPVNEKI
ncbi:MAG: EI24 domain-containing protein [Ginsengibacter sp.]